MWLWRRICLISGHVFKIVGPLWIAGLVILILAILIEPHGEHSSGVQKFFGSALSHIAVALLVGALLVSVEKAVFFHELRDELITLLNLSQRMSVSGLIDVVPRDDRHYSGFRNLIADSKRLTVVVNYGKDWVSNWRQYLSERFDTPGTVTDWFLLDPNSSFLLLLAEKQNREAENRRSVEVAVAELQNKIVETILQLRACYEASKRQGILRIYYIACPLFPTVSVYLGEKDRGEPGEVAITFYTISSHKGAVPLLVFRDNEAHPNTYTFFRDDLDRLRQHHSPFWVGQPPAILPTAPLPGPKGEGLAPQAQEGAVHRPKG